MESLASAYKAEADQLPVAVMKMRPRVRKQFIIDVFKAANFSYAKTLDSVLQSKSQTNSKNTKDLAELLSIPHTNIDAKFRAELYSDQELAAINKIDMILSK